jgi:hypothetical protein
MWLQEISAGPNLSVVWLALTDNTHETVLKFVKIFAASLLSQIFRCGRERIKHLRTISDALPIHRLWLTLTENFFRKIPQTVVLKDSFDFRVMTSKTIIRY